MPDGGNPNANSGKDDKAKRGDKKRKAFTRMFEGITDQYLSDYSERDVDLSGEEEADDKIRPVKEAPEPPAQPEAPKSTGLGSLMASGQNAAAKPEGNKISSLFESSDNLEKPQLPPEVMQQAPQAPPQQPAPQAQPPSDGPKKKGLYTQLLSKPVLPEDIAAAHPPATPGAPPPAPAAPPSTPSAPPPAVPAQPPVGYPAAGRSPGYPSSPSIPMPPMPNTQSAPQPAQGQSPQAQPPYPSSGSAAGYPAPGAYPAASPQAEPLMQQPPAEPAQEAVGQEPAQEPAKGSLPPAPKLGSAQRAPGGSQIPQQSSPQNPASQSPPSQPQRRAPEPTAKEDTSKWKAGFIEKFKDPPARPSNENNQKKVEVPTPPKDGKMHTAETAPSWGLETQKAVERLMLSEGEIPYESAQDRRKKRARRQEEDFEFQSASGKFAGEFTKVTKKNPKVKALLIAANVFATLATAIILYRCHEPGGSGFAIIGLVVWIVAAVAWLWALSLTFNGFKRLLKRPLMFYLPVAGVISLLAMTDVPTQIAFSLCRSSLEVKAADLKAGGEHRPSLAQSSALGLVGLFHVIDYGVDHDGNVYLFTDDEPQPRGFILSNQPPPPAPFGMQLSARRIGEKWFSF